MYMQVQLLVLTSMKRPGASSNSVMSMILVAIVELTPAPSVRLPVCTLGHQTAPRTRPDR